MLCEHVLGTLKSLNPTKKEMDLITLTHDEMLNGHGVLTTQQGRTVKLSLPQGEHLHHGDILYEDQALIIAVAAAPEDALVIWPGSPLDWGKICYNIGNMHMKTYLNPETIISPYDYVLESILIKLGAEYTRTLLPIKGEIANVTAGHHHHSH